MKKEGMWGVWWREGGGRVWWREGEGVGGTKCKERKCNSHKKEKKVK